MVFAWRGHEDARFTRLPLPALYQFEVPRSPCSYALEIVNKQSGGHRKTGIGNPGGYSTPAVKGVYQSSKAGLLLRSG
jgi:hypothetical protein